MPKFFPWGAHQAYTPNPCGALLHWVVLCLIPVSAYAAEPTATASTLESLRAANRARSELAREEAAWDAERQRLEALIVATTAETTRLERHVVEAEATLAAVQVRTIALGSSTDLAAVQLLLRTGGDRLATALNTLAKQYAPGVIPTIAPGETVFDSAMRAVDTAEQAAGRVAVDVVIGRQGEQTEAVTLLHVGGSIAWWLSLDRTRAGTVRVVDGVVMLQPSDDQTRVAIAAAVAQAEGRQTPSVVYLPGMTP